MSRGLESLRARARGLLVARGALMLAAWGVAVCLAAGLADYVLRTPGWLRMILWPGGLGALVVGGLNVLRPAIRFRPTLTEVALRVEKSEPGKAARLGGVLAAGVELGRAVARGEIGDIGASLAEPVVAEAAERFGKVRARTLLTGERARHAGMTLGVGLFSLMAIGVMHPGLVRTGALRVLAPWSGAQWPKRTEVADATHEAVHPLGVALPLRAAVTRGASVEARSGPDARVWAMYRLIADGGAGDAPLTKVLLTNQGKEVQVADGEEVRRGVLFERLIEPAALVARGSDGRAKHGEAGPDAELEYWFETADDRTESRRVKLVEPPMVASATAEVVEPEYARWHRSPGRPDFDGTAGPGKRTIDLGPGSDERANPPAMLAGSLITLRITLSKPVPGPVGDAAERAAWVKQALGESAGALVERESLRTVFDASTWELSWQLMETARLPVKPRDQYGLVSPEESVYRFEAIIDQPPTATVTKPEADESVLPIAVVDAIGEGRDDVGLSQVALERRTARRPGGSVGAPAEAIEDWVEIGAAKPEEHGSESRATTRQLTVESRLDLAERSLKPGDEVWLTALATDAYELGGQTHAPTRSAVRRLTIISPEELAAQVWKDLDSVRRAAIRLDDEEARIAQQTAKGGQSEQAQRAQAAVTDRVARERQDVQRLEDRIERNRMADREMQGLLDQAAGLLDKTGRKSVDAAAAAEQMAKSEAAGQEATQPQKDAAAEAQRQVRDSLEELADLLDKGQDTWAMKRALERALEEQKQLKDRTEAAAKQTTGKSPSELSAQERGELAQIGSEQRALAERTAEVIEKMLRDQAQLKERDKATAKAVEEAAKRGQRDRVADKMNEAARQVEQNQGNSAMADQQRAAQSLQQMLDDMNSASKNKDQELRRVLASLIESIEALIKDQEQQIESLDKAAALPNFAGLDVPMVKLNQNTLGVMEEAGKGPREIAPVVDILGKAAEAEGTAVAALRKSPVEEEPVRTAEELSLERLKQAKEEAQKIDAQAAQREADRKAAELKKAYREALTEQVSIKGETDPLVGVEATRRTRASARGLAERQQAVKDRLVELQDKTKELSEAVIFEYAHKRMDESMGAAAAALREGEPTAATERQQRSSVRVLQALVEALDRSKRNGDDFRDNPSGGGGGGGGRGGPRPLVPAIAQLKLLKAMQTEALDLTKAAGDGHDGAAGEDAAKLQEDLAARAESLLKKMMERPVDNKPGDGSGDGPRPQ